MTITGAAKVPKARCQLIFEIPICRPLYRHRRNRHRGFGNNMWHCCRVFVCQRNRYANKILTAFCNNYRKSY